ncbi:fatty acid CoA ligase family protein [Opitutus sp. ER46]|uniref:fatty acid CoA ligase family protein n=1 Tax=Opitutus sp. ER46 TaxID=2161864 RepID=UPI000D325372|nr:fatty acid CoA ligase family protein [Opitutus sp. ER46]PTX98492.1 peptide synthase [Opitutus sp. ER46]
MPGAPANASANANIARYLTRMAAAQPDRVALKIPRGRRGGEIDYLSLTFAELEAEVAAWSHRLTVAGVRRGDRTLVMVRQGLPLIASVFAVFQLGAVPVIIDPGMGMKSFLACVRHSRPRVLLGIPLAQLISRVFRPSFASVGVRVTASGALTARLTRPAAGPAGARADVARCVATAPDDLAAVLFTSGSTGAPKGVCYQHGMFEAQVRLIRETYGIQPGETDLPLLPVFALFNPALGMTTVVPEIDPRHPAQVDPAKIVQAIQQEQVTNSFGSPTLWRKISEHCVAHRITLPSLRRVLCAGAPVPAALWRNAAAFLPRGQLHSPYGATEALPVATVAAEEIDPASVCGACVGRPVREIDVKIIATTDGPIAQLADARELPAGEIGEIIVRGPVVTQSYDERPDATAAAKIAPAPGTGAARWHRMGDCGYLDGEGRLWFSGRKVERVETPRGTFFTEPCEQVFRAHPRVRRCALIGIEAGGVRQPAIVVEATVRDSAEARHFARELKTLGLAHAHTEPIRVFYFHPKFPVDVRHNAKIHRLTLARWAATAKGFDIEPKR